MAKKKGSVGSGILILGAFIVWAISSVPPEIWEAAAVVLVPCVLLWLMFRKKGNKTQPLKPPDDKESWDELVAIGMERNYADPKAWATNEFNRRVEVISSKSEYRIPGAPTSGKDNAQWISAKESAVIHGYTIKGGLFYLGSRLASQSGGTEPSLINPSLPVAKGQINLSERLMGYWPSYQSISPEARAAYIRWLFDGRNDPDADIGYVFLFFYGLERRALVDASKSMDAKLEIPQIVSEVRRLLKIYSSNRSFQGYAQNFLQTMEAQTVSENLYKNEPPVVSADFRELPFYMRIGLGQLANESKPVSVRWAFFWAFVTADYAQRRRVLRCPDVAEKLFSAKYTKDFGEGLKLPANKTKLRLEYTPASSGIARGRPIPVPGNLSDVTATSLAVKRLLPILNACAEEVDAYGRYISRNAGQENNLEALLQLPLALWPSDIRAELENLKSQIGNSQLIISFGELSGRLKSAGMLNRNKAMGLARALESLQIGMEPDVLAGARMPQAEDAISLFITSAENAATRQTPEYKTAAVVIGLACAVAHADGNFSGKEISYLSGIIDSWQHLSLSQQCRLKAYMQLQVHYPDKLTSLKKKLEPLTEEAKHSVALYSVHLAQADGVVSPPEVKLLEKIYQAIGIDAQQLYSDLHAVGQSQAGAKITTSKQRKVGPVSTENTPLDATRIAMLKKETEQVSTLLAGVFSDEPHHEEANNNDHEADEPKSTDDSILPGLDAEHRAFVQVLHSRSTWSRSELLDVAADMKLLLDGALERINEAAFDRYGEPFCEGDDPVEINAQIMEKLAA